MVHRLTGFAVLAWLMPALSFQGPIAIGTPASVGTTATAVMTSPTLPTGSRASARPAAWTWASFGDRRRKGGFEGDAHFSLLSSSQGPLRAEAAAAAPGGSEDEQPKSTDSTAIVAVEKDDSGGPLKRAFRRVARFFGAGQKMPNIKELGLYAILSYGFVSNTSYSICVGLAWFASSKKSGLSPLAPGQWQVFLVSYAAFFAVNNILRVPRFALSVSLAPAFDRFIAFLMRKTGRRKAVATGLCVFLVNIVGTTTFMAVLILLASLFSGVPIWPVAA
eukprot:g7514.t1